MYGDQDLFMADHQTNYDIALEIVNYFIDYTFRL